MEIVFEIEFINNAWGYNHKGLFVTDDGCVHSYKLPDKNFTSLENKINSAKLVLCLQPILMNILLEEKNKIVDHWVDEERHMFDAGTTFYKLYSPNNNGNTYTINLLAKSGDTNGYLSGSQMLIHKLKALHQLTRM